MELAIIIIIISLVSYFIYCEIRDTKLMNSVTQLHRGTESERKLVVILLKAGIPADDIFHDIYRWFQLANAKFTDAIIINSLPLLVF
jgi:hypothetical protein